ncbi:MAG: hypothetical protein SNJ72_00755 [Fimbriimonadales bacterium]
MRNIWFFSTLTVLAAGISVVASAQIGSATPSLVEEPVQTVVVKPSDLRVNRVYLGGDFQPAGSLPDPYVYLQTMMVRWGADGTYALSFTGFPSANAFGTADDVVVFGGPIDPPATGYDTFTPVACISEIDLLLLNNTTSPLSQQITVEIFPWNGIFGNGAVPSPIATASGTITFAPGLNILTVDVTSAGSNLPVPKAFWVKVTAPNAPTTFGWIIANSTPGNTSLLPGRGYFRRDPVATGGSVFAGLPQGSLALAVRGTHNFVGQIDLGALADRAKPKDPWGFELDADGVDDPAGTGVEEALRRNLIDVEVTNDGDIAPFTSRFTTYIDENGRFTLPVAPAISDIKVRRWDNSLAAVFSRGTGWSADPCNPTVASTILTFGDVNGDGIIDDADLLQVLFGFGSGE